METLVYVLCALLAVAALALLWLGWDSVRQSRRAAAQDSRVNALETHAAEQRATIVKLEDRALALESRADRIQKRLEERGWSDSLDLTRRNWAEPGPF